MPSVTVVNPRCEYLTDPEGIDELKPRLSWELASTARGVVQQGYRILVASSAALLKQEKGDIWDSGRVRSDMTSQVVYRGKALKTFGTYFWTVQVWTNAADGPSRWTKPAFWGMGILAADEWQGGWVGYPISGIHTSPYVRKTIVLTKKVKRAVLYSTAKGIYEAHLNGAKVGNDLFAPGWTDYRIRQYYNSYDVTKNLRKGKNTLGAVLGGGWFKGPLAWANQQNTYGQSLRFLANLRVEFMDGTSKVFTTDESWKTSNGPILQSTFLWGENYDSRLELTGWDTPGYDDSGWQPVVSAPCSDYWDRAAGERPEKLPPLQSYPNEPVRRHELMVPEKIWQAPKGSWVFDLGQNFAGRAILKVKEKAGTVVRLRFAEMVNADKTMYVENLRTAISTDTYVCSGKGVEEWEPTFTFHGFRYVEVTGISSKPTKETVTGVVISSDTPRVGNFRCSDPMLNKLYSNALWTQRSNFIDIPTDCPQRDERLGWTGDAQVYIRTAAANMDVAAFFKKWLVDLEDTQKPGGAVANVAPAGIMKDMAADAGWGDAMVICPWVVYNVYGDERILQKHFPAMKKWIGYLKSTSKGLVRGFTHCFGDWLSINADTTPDILQTAFFAYATGLTAQVARVLKRTKDAEELERLHRDIVAVFNKKFVKPNGRVHSNTQTAYLLALHFDLLPEALRPKAARHLMNEIKKRDNHLSTGFLGTPYLLHVLQRFGYTDMAYTLLTNKTYPGWGYSVENGATTIWERWNSYTHKDGFGNSNMNSFSHYAYGSVCEWMYKTVAGIDLAAPGFGEIVIRPVPGGGISHAEATYRSIRGEAAVAWKLKGKTFSINVTLPPNTTATIHIPTADAASVSESGRPLIEAAGILHAVIDGDCLMVQAGSGTYSFKSRM